MLTTSENNYKRSLFSFQWSCINQFLTQSIGIHLKRKIREIIIKKKTQTNLNLALARKTSLIVHSGFKMIKKPLTACTTGTPCPGSLCSGGVSTNHSGEVSPCIALLSFSTVGGWSTNVIQTGARKTSPCH